MPTRLPLQWLRALIWALCLALPLQAAAIVGMAACGSMQLAQALQHETGDLPTAHLQHQLQDDHHQTCGQCPDHADAGAHKCSACAACCVGAVLPSAALDLPAAAGHGVQTARPQCASLSRCDAPLERPPRTVLA